MYWRRCLVDASLVRCFARQLSAGKSIEDVDLYGPSEAIAGVGVSNAD
jgi:hypothetical protein